VVVTREVPMAPTGVGPQRRLVTERTAQLHGPL
jgi:hypothetical protein